MKKSLVLAEKPSVGKDIARVLGCQPKGPGSYENQKYIVTWGFGHLVTLATPDKYNKAYESWKMEDLPILPSPFKLEVIPKTSKHYYQVIKLMQRDDVGEIIIATDAGREGELVARWILEKGQIRKPIKRLWISSVTDKAIKEGFAKLKEGRLYDPLFAAAKARAYADWIVGLNATRALTCQHNASLSCGRVQTPTLKLIDEREELIRKFKPETYFELGFVHEGLSFKYRDVKSKEARIFDEKVANDIQQKVMHAQGKVTELERSQKSSHAPGLYDLTTLQRDANRLYGYSAKETLNLMQALYERHKVLTYPRTDSKFISKDVVPTLKDRLRAIQVGPYKGFVADILRQPIKTGPSFVNDAKVSDHHAIIPTEESVQLSSLSPKEMKIYDLVIKRFLSVFMAPYLYEQVKVQISMGQFAFHGTALVTKEAGFKALYQGAGLTQSIDEEAMPSSLPGLKMKLGDTMTINNVKKDKLLTKPKARLTEGELLGLMEKFGLGTVATRGDIIEKIIDNAYVEKQGQSLMVTKTGRQLLDLVPEGLKETALTAKWEKDLESIAKGQLSADKFLQEMTQYAKTTVNAIKLSTKTFKPDNLSHEKCPECGKQLMTISNKNGKRLVCSDRSCGYKKNIAQTTNARCPDCHKKLNLVGEGDAKTFVCQCGYKEKLAAFEARRANQSKNMSKKEVENFMANTMKKEETFNNPFAQLLGQIKDDK